MIKLLSFLVPKYDKLTSKYKSIIMAKLKTNQQHGNYTDTCVICSFTIEH